MAGPKSIGRSWQAGDRDVGRLTQIEWQPLLQTPWPHEQSNSDNPVISFLMNEQPDCQDDPTLKLFLLGRKSTR